MNPVKNKYMTVLEEREELKRPQNYFWNKHTIKIWKDFKNNELSQMH